MADYLFYSSAFGFYAVSCKIFLTNGNYQVDPSKELSTADAQGKTSVSGGTSRFSRFGFGSQLLQKTVGLVLRPRPGKQVVFLRFFFL